MKFASTIAAITVLAASTALAQSAVPAPSSHPRRVVAEGNALAVAENAQAQTTMHQRVADMGNTLTRMHTLLKQMQGKISASGSHDPMVKANLEMWGLMLEDLDKQYVQLRVASHAREDLESRRAALYKQAEAKAAMGAKNPQGSAGANEQGMAPSAAGTSAAAPASPATQPAAGTSSPQ